MKRTREEWEQLVALPEIPVVGYEHSYLFLGDIIRIKQLSQHTQLWTVIEWDGSGSGNTIQQWERHTDDPLRRAVREAREKGPTLLCKVWRWICMEESNENR